VGREREPAGESCRGEVRLRSKTKRPMGKETIVTGGPPPRHEKKTEEKRRPNGTNQMMKNRQCHGSGNTKLGGC